MLNSATTRNFRARPAPFGRGPQGADSGIVTATVQKRKGEDDGLQPREGTERIEATGPWVTQGPAVLSLPRLDQVPPERRDVRSLASSAMRRRPPALLSCDRKGGPNAAISGGSPENDLRRPGQGVAYSGEIALRASGSLPTRVNLSQGRAAGCDLGHRLIASNRSGRLAPAWTRPAIAPKIGVGIS